ncbi:type II secretion system protein [Pseudalkalibacillus hwajinpoensis]|uniref:type II secretion system protein n=1 Tax=Guptibacillus hwajinpoensis TaxID=208199 RepID=UPI00325BC688
MLYKSEAVVSIFKSCRGYTLLDALTALSILTVLSLSILPLYTHLYEERSAISERREAVMLLDQYWLEFVLEGLSPPSEFSRKEVSYLFQMSTDQLCISFEDVRKRRTSICRSLPDEG